MKTRILYLNPIGEFSGACKSLAELLKAPELAGIRPVVLCPAGTAADYFVCQGFEVITTRRLSQFDHTRYGRYRGMRWLIAVRELLLLPGTYFAVRAAMRQVGPVAGIHVNEITGLVPGLWAQRRARCPLIMHIRAHMGDQSRGWRSRLLWGLVKRRVAHCICIDETVSASVPAAIARSVVHNSIDVAASPIQVASNWAQAMQGVPPGVTKVAIIGTLHPVKGVREFVEAAAAIARRRQDICFFIVGRAVRRVAGWRGALLQATGLAVDLEEYCRKHIAAAGVGTNVLLVGHVEDPRAVYRDIDVLCFPSYYEALGRPVFEAGFFGKPSIVAIERPRPDTLVDGVTGIAIPARSVPALVRAVEELVDDPARRNRLGAAAKDLAVENFDCGRNAAAVARIYARVFGLPELAASAVTP